jgi:hypothetical protein
MVGFSNAARRRNGLFKQKGYKMAKKKTTKSDKLTEWLDRFFKGFTAFHLVGFLMMFFGGRIGDKGGFNGQGFGFTLTLTELAGFLTYFIPALKAWRESRIAAKAAKAADGP